MLTLLSPMQPARKQRQCILQLLLFLTSTKYYNSLCEHTYLLQHTILLQHLLSWHHLMDCGDASSFFLMPGLPGEVLIMLLDILQPPGHVAHINRKGCKLSFPSDAFLGLLLFYWGSKIDMKLYTPFQQALNGGCGGYRVLSLAVRHAFPVIATS